MSTTAAPPPYAFDARPLREPVDRAAARAYTRELRRTGRAPSGTGVVGIVLVALFGMVFLFMFGSVFVGIASTVVSMAATGGTGAGALVAFAPLLLLAVVVGVAGYAGWRAFTGSTAERWYRLDRFARANGMSWHPVSPAPPLPGMIFAQGSGRQATDVVRGTVPRFVEFGNHQYTTGSGKNQTTHRWGYVAVKLTSPLPHIVLDATSNNALFGSNLPTSFDRGQRLRLEGDFDRHFALYCPKGYEPDALYLFTPDIMARFIDHAAALDVEIVDDWLFLYAKRDFSTLDPATWSWLFSIVGALIDKFAQWERWRDDRLGGGAPVDRVDHGVQVGADAGAHGSSRTDATGMDATGTDTAGTDATTPAGVSLPFAAPTTALRPPPGVAAQGRRLRRGFPWPAVIVIGVAVVFWLLMQGGVVASVLGGLLR